MLCIRRSSREFSQCRYFCGVAILAVALNCAPADAQTSTKPKQKQAESTDTKKAAGFLRARVAFAGLLTAAYQKLGYRLRVEANGSDKRTLEISSALLAEGSHTMEAALEVLEDADIFANVKNCRFTKVLFTGGSFSIEYSIAEGKARRTK